MDTIISAPQNIPSPALGWFRKVVSALNTNSNAVGDSSQKKSFSDKSQTSASSLYAPHQLQVQNGVSVPSCCLQSITPCSHSANHAIKLAALAASGSSFIPPVARVHANVNVTANTLYWDYERASLESLRLNAYQYNRTENCVGSGRYSQVYTCIDVRSSNQYVVKLIRPGKAKRIRREVLILKNLQNGPNIIPLIGFFTDPEYEQPALVFKFINSPANWREMFNSFSSTDVKLYMYKLLQALAYAHSKGIIHRDVKPQNCMFDPESKELRLIDWGLAEFYFPYQKYSTRVASRFFKSPEILLGYGA
ncbi:hypothetical protein HK096_011465, partial [Nowakowskiella sp. JEL0078]